MFSSIPASSVIEKIAQAIAFAEGFYVPNSRPARNHNPGDMERDLINKAVGWDGPFAIYGCDEDGWGNLYIQVSKFFHGSLIYNPTMSITEVSTHWTEDTPVGAQSAWASNVAKQLDVPTSTRLCDIV